MPYPTLFSQHVDPTSLSADLGLAFLNLVIHEIETNCQEGSRFFAPPFPRNNNFAVARVPRGLSLASSLLPGRFSDTAEVLGMHRIEEVHQKAGTRLRDPASRLPLATGASSRNLGLARRSLLILCSSVYLHVEFPVGDASSVIRVSIHTNFFIRRQRQAPN